MDGATLIPVLVAGLAVTSVFLLSAGVISWLGGDSRVAKLKERLAAQETGGHARATDRRRFSTGLSRVLSVLGKNLGPRDDEQLSKAQLALLQAGVRKPNASLLFQGAKALATLILAGTGLIVRSLLLPDLSLAASIFIILGLAAVGCYGPEIWLRIKTSKRRERLSDELPDALDLLVVCVESGMGLDQAVHRVCTELFRSAPLLSQEFKILTLQMRAGKPRQEALRDLSRRVGLDDLNSLCTLLIQADAFGISVSKTLRVYSDVLRTNRYQRAEEKAAKLPVKLLFPLIFFILPALFVVIMGPAGIKMMGVMRTMN